MKKVLFAAVSILFLMTGITLQSCVKGSFDAPPDNSGFDPKLDVTMTIAELQQLPMGEKIEDDAIISGIVVMDDKSGNYFKKIVIQDTTGGIEILIDQNNLYNDYPIGRKIYVKLKGLFLGNYGQNPQLGYTPDAAGSVSSIPFVLVNDFIVKANYPNEYQVDTFTIAQLASPNAALSKLNTIVAIRDVEFAPGFAGVPYAQQASLASATNLTFQDCSNATMVMRTSGYAKFQPYLTPTGNGVLVGLYTRFNNTPQIYIRDTSDVKLYNPRCDGQTPGGAIVTLFTEDFSSGAENTPVAWQGGYNIQEAGTVPYIYSGPTNRYAKISAYGTGQPDVKSWLIIPKMDFTNYINPKMTLSTTYAFPDGASLKAYASTDFDGSNLASANWVELSSITTPGQPNWAFKPQEVDLKNWEGQKVFIGFKYVGGSVGTSTYEIDNIKIVAEQQ